MGTATVSSGTWASSSYLFVGDSGTGTLNVTGGSVTNTFVRLGNAPGSIGTATVSSGTWASSSTLSVGYQGSGTINVTGGSVTNNLLGYLGREGGSSGVANVSSGTWANSSDLYVGNSGTGTLNVTGGSVTNSAGYLGYNASGVGTATVSSGTWGNSGDLTVGVSGTATLTMTGGLVTVGGTAGTGMLTLASGSGSRGTLNLGTGGLVGTLQTGTVAGGAGTAAVVFNHTSSSYAFAPRLTGTMSVTQSGNGTTALTGSNTYTGTTTISSGMLQVGSGGTTGIIGSGSVVNNATLVFNRSDDYGGPGSPNVTRSITGSGTVQLLAGSLTLSGSSSYSGGTVVRGGTLSLAPTGVIAHGTANVVVGRLSGDIGALSLGAGTLTGSNGILGNDSGASGVASVSGSGVWTSNGSLTVGSLGTGTLSIADTGLVRVGGTAGNGTLTLASGSGSRGTLNLGTGGLVGTLQTGTVAGGAGTAAVVFNHTSGSYAFAPNITGTLNLAHSGSGTTILVGANTYTGTTTLAAGVLQAGNPAALGSTGTISFTGGALRFTAASAATDWSPRIAGSSGPVALDLAGQGVTLGSTFAGSLGASNTGGLTVIGPGQLTLAGNAAYSGTTTIQATGTLQVGNPNGGTVTPNSGSLGTGPVVANGALVFNRGDDYGGAVGNVISGSGNLVLTRGSLTLSAGNSYGGGTTIRSGALALSGGSISHPGAALVVGDVSGDNAALLLPSGVVTNESGSVGRGAGSVGLATVSGGTWANSGDLNVGVSGTGTLTMTGGVVTVGGTLSRGTFGTINLNAGGTLQIGTGGTTGALAVSTLTNNGTLIFNRSNSSEYAGVISGSGAVAKQGAGNLVLAGTSSYTGATTVSAGRLSVDGALGNSPVAILAAAELGGSGAIGGAVSVAAGGTLSPGNSIESLSTGAGTFAAGATFEYEVDSTNLSALGSAADLLVVNGNLTLDPGNGTILAFTDLAGSPNAFIDNTTIFALINYSGAWNGGLFTYGGSVLADGGRFFVGTQEWEIDYDRTSAAGLDNFTADYLPAGSFVAITAVPEPSTWALAAGGLACAAWGAWRQRMWRRQGRSLTAVVSFGLTAALLSTYPAHAVTYTMVTVGNAGNANDVTGYGAVAYEYMIGKYEVTIGQYTEFLNAVDPDGMNPYDVYLSAMGTNGNVRGILYSSGSPRGQKYTTIGSASRPITYVSWFTAARFANWMHNGQGNGSTETGAYTLVGGATSGTAPARNANAAFSIPTDNEWYKAAFYSPLLNSGSGGYFMYATQSDTAPGNTIGTGTNQANYYVGSYPDGAYATGGGGNTLSPRTTSPMWEHSRTARRTTARSIRAGT